jgi:hypothetical protein
MTYVTRHIDWLSFSIQEADDPRMVFPLLDWHYVGAGHHGYRTRFVCRKTQAEIETDSTVYGMGSFYRFSGDALEALRQEFGGTDDGLVNRVVRSHGKASRIDLTINIHDGNLTPRDVQRAVKSGHAKARANVSRFIEGQNGEIQGDTFYIGSPSSDRQFRAYNKGSELGIVDGEAWLRLELELRRFRSDGALKSCACNGTDATVAGHMGDFLGWGNMEYQAALGQRSVSPVDIPRKDSNRRRWLLGQVAQAMAKEACVDPDFVTQFVTTVNQLVDNIKSTE